MQRIVVNFTTEIILQGDVSLRFSATNAGTNRHWFSLVANCCCSQDVPWTLGPPHLGRFQGIWGNFFEDSDSGEVAAIIDVKSSDLMNRQSSETVVNYS